jgi:drug/metabolite transporter (DMT)-like permease
VVLSSRAVVGRDPVLVVACQQLVAGILALFLLPTELTQGNGIASDHLSPSAWTLAVGSGVVQYALAFSFYLAAMRSMSTSLVGAFLYLGPIIGLAGAVIFLGEKFTPLQLGGAAIVVGALLLLSWRGTAADTTRPHNGPGPPAAGAIDSADRDPSVGTSLSGAKSFGASGLSDLPA